MSEVPICIDVSHHNGSIDWEEVRASGVLGIVHKASEGCTYADPMRAENCAAAKKAGLAISTYHWLSPDSDPDDQMEFYLSTIEPVQGERVVIDYEENGCTLDMLHDAVQALLDYGQDLQIAVYSGHLLKEQLGDDCDDFLRDQTSLWLAQYTSGAPSWPDSTYDDWTLWQYSESGTIPGINDAYVDLNNFNGSNEQFLKWINPAGVTPPPAPEPTPSATVVVAITVPEGIVVDVTVNGGPTTPRRVRPRRKVRHGPDLTGRSSP